MGRLSCPCGHIISDVASPNPYEGHLLGDLHYDHRIASIDRARWIARLGQRDADADALESVLDELLRHLWHRELQAFECSACGRIALQVGGTNRFRFYSPESDDRGIFAWEPGPLGDD